MLSKKIKKRRESLKLSQSELARLVGKTPNYICQLEKNHLTPSLKSLQKIARALHIKVSLLLSDNMARKRQSEYIHEEYINKLIIILNKHDPESRDLIKKVIDFLIVTHPALRAQGVMVKKQKRKQRIE